MDALTPEMWRSQPELLRKGAEPSPVGNSGEMDSSLLPPTGELPPSVLFLSNANASHRHSAGGELSVRYMGIYGSSRCVFKARHKRAAAFFFGLGLLRCIMSFLAFVITDGGWIVFFFSPPEQHLYGESSSCFWDWFEICPDGSTKPGLVSRPDCGQGDVPTRTGSALLNGEKKTLKKSFME